MVGEHCPFCVITYLILGINFNVDGHKKYDTWQLVGGMAPFDHSHTQGSNAHVRSE